MPDAPARLAEQVARFVQQLRTAELYKVSGVSETLDWIAALVALDRHELDHDTIDDTLGLILKTPGRSPGGPRSAGQAALRAQPPPRRDSLSRCPWRCRTATSSPNLLRFGRLLRDLGLDAQAGNMLDVYDALAHVDIGRRSDFYYTLRTLLVRRAQDLPVFDQAFRLFWRPPPADRAARDARAASERRRQTPSDADAPPSRPADAPPDGGTGPLLELQQVMALTYSARQVSRSKDFATFTDTEISQARRHAGLAAVDARGTDHPALATRRRRRHRHSARRPPQPALRRGDPHAAATAPAHPDQTARAALRRERIDGALQPHAAALRPHPGERLRPSRNVPVLDQAHAGHAAARAARRRRCRPDPAAPRTGLGRRNPHRRRAARVQHRLVTPRDGTRPVVLLISDGWDRGEPARLGDEMARLQRRCHRLIWLNPLLGSPLYRPLTRGMQAALPWIDDFLPVHNLASLDALPNI